jgi:hypothetical protein
LSTAHIPEDFDALLPESILKKFEGQQGNENKIEEIKTK